LQQPIQASASDGVSNWTQGIGSGSVKAGIQVGLDRIGGDDANTLRIVHAGHPEQRGFQFFKSDPGKIPSKLNLVHERHEKHEISPLVFFRAFRGPCVA